jgi:5-methylcytosine-specific restriction endonuclease McrA
MTRRAVYSDYMASPAWYRHREHWVEKWAARRGREPCCLVCGAPWALRDGDLHHRTYIRLGHEADSDLVPMCRDCHRDMHRILESAPSWRRLDRPQATDLIMVALRAKIGSNQ